MEVFNVDHGSTPSFDYLFKDVTYYAKLLDNQGGDEITSTKEENKKSDANNKRRRAENKVGEEEEYGIWSKLPRDLQISIMRSISSIDRDYRNIRAVCRRWRSLAPPLRWIPDSEAIRYPWLVSFRIEDSIFNFYDPTSDFTYEMNTGASNPGILSSCEGWLLLAEGERSIYMLEPFRKITIDLPLVPEPFDNLNGLVCAIDKTTTCYHFTRIYCTSSGQLRDLEFSSKRAAWAQYSVNGVSFLSSWNNLVIFRGCVHCLDQVGRLGRLRTVGNTPNWLVLNESQQLSFPSKVWQNFLVSFKDKLTSVFVGNSGGWVHVLEFNFSTHRWEQVDSLGNLVLFVGRTSIAVEAEEERLRNKIFFPVFKKADGNIIFYSLDSGRFHSFSSENSCADFHGTEDFKILSNCTWIQPGLISTFR
ncbi:F-box/kelch-repeat protein At1g57790-like isoform X1 [Rhododendron vialii]|uniref:F-box/kelch-repeat protein At1g57790-like isoform X1 n=2 Tax=Rhododendron vialii TaxID=182163 RepID=UPI0026601232|nr:F-box/kelch-repeat protein At1g57790-like isoform X1 [Rhododendron vialii]